MKWKKIIKKVMFPGLVQDHFDGKYSFGLRELSGGYLKSFGDANPDKTFYVIWRDHLGSGFFSNFTQVLSHIKLAESFGMIPVVDYQNFKTLYNVEEAINGSQNAWEYYFKQPSDFTLDEAYQSKRVFIADGEYPRDVFFATAEEYHDFCIRHIHPQENVVERIKSYIPKISSGRTLGVHFRGKEMNYTPRHTFAPTPAQVFSAVDTLMEEFAFDQIFIVTEELSYLELFLQRYGERVIFTDSFRSKKVNSYNLSPRPLHRYLLGLEILADTEILARCHGLLCSNTGPANHALRSSKTLEVAEFIDNGVNSSNYIIAKYLYQIKKSLPQQHGGLPGRIKRILNPPDAAIQ